MVDIVGLIPAAGKATRLAPFPCDKELFPLGGQEVLVDGVLQWRPKVVSQYLIENMIRAGAKRLFVILGEGKQGIMEYFGDGNRLGVQVAYLYQEKLNGLPAALSLAQSWLRDEVVLFGMPDTVIEPEDAFRRLLVNHLSDSSDVTLGLFRTTNPAKFGMVQFSAGDLAEHFVDKPDISTLEYMWGMGCWSRSFTEFLGDWTRRFPGGGREALLSNAFQHAVESGLCIKVLRFDDGCYIDVGTADDLMLAIERYRAAARSGSSWRGNRVTENAEIGER